MTFQNTGKNPNLLHDFLIKHNCRPVALSHNAQYGEEGKLHEATEICIEIEPEKESLLSQLVNQFMSQ